jgi:hypothetical protein
MRFFNGRFFDGRFWAARFWGGTGEATQGPYIVEEMAVFRPGGIRLGIYKQ